MRVVRTGRASSESTSQTVSQPFGRSSCGGIDLADLQIFHERLIDCDHIDAKPLEIRKARIARPKIIDRQSSFRPELDGENIKKTLCDLHRIFEFRQIG